MINALRTAATGMEAQQIRIDNIANDLANINTVGYKRSTEDFEDLYYDQIKTPGALNSQSVESPNGIQVGHGTKLTSISKLFTEGVLQQTGRDLDVAIEGNGFFKVTNADGQTMYTRNGSWILNKDRQLCNSNGLLVDPQITIAADATSVAIGKDGTVSVTTSTDPAPTNAGQIDLVTFANPGGLRYAGAHLYAETSASGSPVTSLPGASGAGTITEGFLENSNVNMGESLINMIVAQRSYETNAKVIEAADKMMQAINSIV
jgi:flagellar basal-body rod protein FlgG